MSCTNKVAYHVARGYSYREIRIRCGYTDPYGGRVVCDDCEEKYGEQIRSEEKAIASDNWASRSAGWGDW